MQGCEGGEDRQMVSEVLINKAENAAGAGQERKNRRQKKLKNRTKGAGWQTDGWRDKNKGKNYNMQWSGTEQMKTERLYTEGASGEIQ